MSFVYSLADTWNNVATTFSSIFMNVSNGTGGAPVGAAASRVIRLQNNGADVFGVDVNGQTFLVAGTTTASPLNFASGTNLTTAAAGATEYDGVQQYFTIDATSGRGAVVQEQYFHLTANGGAISTIANFFGATSNLNLVANAFYIIEIVAFFTVTTGTQTLTWTFTNSAAPTNQNIYYESSPDGSAAIAPPGSATAQVGQIQGDATAARTIVTAALTAGLHYARIKIWLQNGAGTSLLIQATSSANSITPLNGSWLHCRRMSPNNIGTFHA